MPPKLTLGMAVYDDFPALALTVQSARLHNRFGRGELELVVVDNHPGPGSGRLESFCRQVDAVYVPFPNPVGTSAARDVIFAHAKGETVCVIDSHVLLPWGTLQQLAKFADRHPDSLDLWHGPLLYDPLDPSRAATHMQPAWGPDLMFGVWEHDPRGEQPGGEPFEIPMHGLGLFACRRAAWPGFPPGLEGFGGEEGMIHERFRQLGRKVLCLPFLRWWHLFRDEAQPVRFPVRLVDRFRNYLIWHLWLGLDPSELLARFRPVLRTEEFARAIESSGAAGALKPPGIVAQASSLARAIAKYAMSGGQNVSDAQYEARLEICRACPFHNQNRCQLCGCQVDHKAVMATESCPANKWPGDRPATTIGAGPIPGWIPSGRAARQSCTHGNFNAQVHVLRTPNGTIAAVSVTCRECGLPFVFPTFGGQPNAALPIVPAPA